MCIAKVGRDKLQVTRLQPLIPPPSLCEIQRPQDVVSGREGVIIFAHALIPTPLIVDESSHMIIFATPCHDCYQCHVWRHAHERVVVDAML